jgi:hypothetical protein
MSQTVYIPIGERSTLCVCDERHHWVLGEESYQCECGRMYRKAADYAFSSSHLHYESDGDVIFYVEDFEL